MDDRAYNTFNGKDVYQSAGYVSQVRGVEIPSANPGWNQETITQEKSAKSDNQSPDDYRHSDLWKTEYTTRITISVSALQ